MTDIFDEIESSPAKTDIFDEIEPQGDIFDSLAASGDIFDEVQPGEIGEPMDIPDESPDFISALPRPEDKAIVEDFLAPTAEAIPRVAGAVGGSMALLPGAGLRSAGEFLETEDQPGQTPGFVESLPGFKEKPLERAGKTFKQIMDVPAQLIQTPEQAQALENIGLVMKPIEMSAEGWRLIGEQAEKGLKDLGVEVKYIEPTLATMGEGAAIFAIPGVIKAIKNSTTFRKMTIPERGLVVQNLAETMKKNPGMTEGEILRRFNNPSWQAEALARRIIPEAKPLKPVKPSEPIKPEEVKIDAKEIRKDAGRVQERGLERPGGKEKSGQDLQQPKEIRPETIKQETPVIPPPPAKPVSVETAEPVKPVETPKEKPKNKIPEDIRESISIMRSELANSESRGVTRDAEGNLKGYSSSSPEWFTELQKTLKTARQPLFSRKEFENLIYKQERGISLTAKQIDRWTWIEDAAKEFKNKQPELVAGQDIEYFEKQGYDVLGGEDISAINLNEGDKVFATIDGVKDLYTVKGMNKAGDVVFQDGTQKTVDAFDQVTIEAIKRFDPPKQPEEQSILPPEKPPLFEQEKAVEQKKKREKKVKGTSNLEQQTLLGPKQKNLFMAESASKTEPPKPSGKDHLRIKHVPVGLRRSAMLNKISKRLSLPIRTGKFRKNVPFSAAKKAGIYKPGLRVVRLARANDFVVAMHEVGHDLQRLLAFTDKMPEEITAMAYEGAAKNAIDKEGFAEFIKYYVTDQPKAKAEAPNFYKVFEERLKEFPDVQDLIVESRNFWNDWKAAPSVEKIGSFIKKGGEKKSRVSFNKIYTDVVDEIYPLQVLKNIAETRKGGPLRPSEDPLTLAWLLRGWARKAEQYLKYGTFQLTEKGVSFTGKSLKDILGPIEKQGLMDQLDIYLVSKRAASDKRITKGFEKILGEGDFKQAAKELEPKFKKVADELYNYNDQLLTYLEDSGRLSKTVGKQIRERNLFYTPMYRVMDSEAPLSGLSRRKYGNLFNPIKKLKGSSRDIYSPTESMLYNTYSMINIAERNRIGEALLKLAKIQDMGDLIEIVPAPMKQIKITTKEALEKISKNLEGIPSDIAEDVQVVIDQLLGHQFKVKNIIESAKDNIKNENMSPAEAFESAIAAQGMQPEDVFLLDEMLTTFRPDIRTKPNEILLYSKGEPYIVEMPQDLINSIQALDAESINLLVKILSYPAKWLRAGATLTPEFIARNPARDQLTAWVYSKYGYIPLVDAVKGAFNILGKTELWQEFNASGAAHSALVSLDRNYISKNLNDVLKEHKISSLIKNPLKAVQMLSELTEEATRVGEFINAKKANGESIDSILTAGKEARDITLDFQGIGLKTKSMNMITAFFNAQIRGTDKFVRAFKNNPKKTFLKAFLGITVPSILLWLAQKDDPYYQEIPSWRRIFFWNFVTHNQDGSLKHIWSIPKPFEVGLLFGSFPEMVLDYWYEKDPEALKDTLRAVVDGLFPSLIPTSTIPIVEWFANRSIFFDRPIVPRGKEDLEPVAQYTPHTSETVKLIAKVLDKIPGAKEVASPAKIENLIRGYTGGLGKYSMDILDKLIEEIGIIDVPEPPSKSLSDAPLIRGFSQRFPTANTRSIERFYTDYYKQKRAWETKKELAGVRGYGIKIDMPEDLEEKSKIADALSLLRKLVDATYKSNMSPEDKKKEIDRYYLIMINMARSNLGKKQIKEAEVEK